MKKSGEEEDVVLRANQTLSPDWAPAGGMFRCEDWVPQSIPEVVLSADGDAEEFQRQHRVDPEWSGAGCVDEVAEDHRRQLWSATCIGVSPEIAREISREDCVGFFGTPTRASDENDDQRDSDGAAQLVEHRETKNRKRSRSILEDASFITAVQSISPPPSPKQHPEKVATNLPEEVAAESAAASPATSSAAHATAASGAADSSPEKVMTVRERLRAHVLSLPPEVQARLPERIKRRHLHPQNSEE